MRYYRVNYRRTRLREFVRLSHPRLAQGVVVWALVRLGIARMQSPIMPRPDSIADLEVDDSEIPEPARTSVLSSVAEAASLGFVDPAYELVQTGGLPVTGVCVRCRHRDRRSILTALCSFAGALRSCELHVVSFFEDGSTHATVGGRPKYDRHPSSDASYHPGKPLPELLKAHEEILAGRSARPIPVGTREELVRRVDAMSDRFFDFLAGRGVLEQVAGPSTDTQDEAG